MIGRTATAIILALGFTGHGALVAHADQFKLHYTLALDGAAPAHGELVCETGVRCEVRNGDARFSLTTSADPERPHLVRLDCGLMPCSFQTEHSSVEYRKELMPIGFHIYSGVDESVIRHLVHRPRNIIGWLMLTY